MELRPDVERRRVKQIFEYLRSLNELRNPVTRRIAEQPWHLWLRDLPDHEAVDFQYTQADDSEDEDNSADEDGAVEEATSGRFSLTLKRPNLTPPPAPPEPLAPWLTRAWRSADSKVEVHPTRNERDAETGETRVVAFEDDPERERLLNDWGRTWAAWAEGERPALEAHKLFENVYELYSRLERESERLELVLGNGVLNQRLSSGGVDHPVLLRRLNLSFDPEVPAFTFTETDNDVELYAALFREMDGVDASVERRHSDELKRGQFHPLGAGDTAGFFKSFVNSISSRGEYIEEGPLQGEKDDPRLCYDPVLFMRPRVLGYAASLDKVLVDLDADGEIPNSLARIVGQARPIKDGEGSGGPVTEADILLSKPANAEQIQIAQRLDQHGAVIVQGPPGTGKTHTIANLIGHLLAHGKSVLVTSQTSKALSRVRDQLVEPLQSLCVSVLGSDTQSQDELKRSIESIASHIASKDADKLEQDADRLARHRRNLVERLAEQKQALLQARRAEYDDVVIDGTAYPPSEAARVVAKGKQAHGWIPGPVEAGATLLLSPEEILTLYRTNESVSEEEEQELSAGLPAPESLPSPDEYRRRLEAMAELEAASRDLGTQYWADPHEGSLDVLSPLENALKAALETLGEEAEWKLEALEAGSTGSGRREAWDDLLRLITAAQEEADAAENLLVTHDPQLDGAKPMAEQEAVLREMYEHVREKGKLGRLALIFNGEWKVLLENVRVEGREPRTAEEFEALYRLSSLERKRERLVARWDRMVGQRGGLAADQLGGRPERVLSQRRTEIEATLAWFEAEWRPLRRQLDDVGFKWKAHFDDTPPPVSEHAGVERLRWAVEALPALLAAHVNRIKYAQAQAWLANLEGRLRRLVDESGSELVRRVLRAVHAREAQPYEDAYRHLSQVYRRQADLQVRGMLLTRLTQCAPGWAHATRHRTHPHDASEPPGDVARAWEWRLLHDELERRGSLSLDALQRQIDKTSEELQRITAELVESRAWSSQVRRLQKDHRRRQALIGWLDTIRKIGKGTGKRAPKLRREARQLMKQCKGAVPVWVMPMTGVVENFDPHDTRFDVVIIDEASQVDVMGLIPLYMAREVVVVGDHEQVSPSAVGQKIDEVEYLIDAHLAGIPNAQLYDGKTSVYDLARQSFGGMIGLREHFRCVPEIIQFSNALSYDFSIRPLRDASNVRTKPHVVAHRVADAQSTNNANAKEALEVASLLVAATEQPEYAGKTFGVVTLVGDRQAELIEQHLRRHLTPVQYEKERRILCGNPAQFQGDERDVMFVSVVDSPGEGPLRMRDGQMFKQRFNVAASRARDQMWVVHSLSPDVDLKDGDLRKRLIEHAQNPHELMERMKDGERRTESEFERLVLRRLVARGYRVVPQWEVGAYRIDLVVEGPDGKTLAVECDGDRYHPAEKLADDMARQATLERLGWTFVRIRGSAFFRDPDEAMEPVFGRLEELEVHPSAGDEDLEPREPNELLGRIRRRAASLREAWGEDPYRVSTKPATPRRSSTSPAPTSQREQRDPKPDTQEGRREERPRPGAARRSGARTSQEEHGDGVPSAAMRPGLHSEKPPAAQPKRHTHPPEEQLDFEFAPSSRAGHKGRVDGVDPILRALYHVIVPGRVMEREAVLQHAAQYLGEQLNKTVRSQLNKAIRAEVQAGKMEVLNGWKEVRRAG